MCCNSLETQARCVDPQAGTLGHVLNMTDDDVPIVDPPRLGGPSITRADAAALPTGG